MALTSLLLRVEHRGYATSCSSTPPSCYLLLRAPQQSQALNSFRWQKLGCCGDKPSQRLGVVRFVDAGLHFSGLTGWARSSTLERLDAFLFIDAGELILLKHVWCLNALWSLITVGDLECASLNENLSLSSSLLILCVLTCGYGYL